MSSGTDGSKALPENCRKTQQQTPLTHSFPDRYTDSDYQTRFRDLGGKHLQGS